MARMNIENLDQFEKAVISILNGETRENLLDFARYLRFLGMMVSGNSDDGQVIFKDKKVCDFHFSGNFCGYPAPWTVWMTGDYGTETESIPNNERLMEIVWANVHFCENCGGSSHWCGSGKRRKIFGRDFENLCVSPIVFNGSDFETVECMKKLVEMRKNAIDND